MRRSIMFMVLAAVAVAPSVASAKPGPHGSNNHGMCTAYFAGSEQGRAQKRKAKPFVELERVATEAYDAEHGENEATIDEKVRWWCDANDPKVATDTTTPEPDTDEGTATTANSGKTNGKKK